MLSHDELQALVSGYALNALDSEERLAFEEHLSTCNVCPTQVTEMRSLAHALPLIAEERAPTPQLKDRILAAARADKAAASVPPSTSHPSTPPWWQFSTQPAVVAVTIAVLLLAVAGLVFWTLDLRNSITTNEVRLAKSYMAIDIMGQADKWWRIEGTDAAPGVTGILAYSSHESAACLVVWDLPQTDRPRYYAWATKNGTPTRIGYMWPMDKGMWVIIRGDVDEIDTVTVTLEEAGGLMQPKGPVMVNLAVHSDR